MDEAIVNPVIREQDAETQKLFDMATAADAERWAEQEKEFAEPASESPEKLADPGSEAPPEPGPDGAKPADVPPKPEKPAGETAEEARARDEKGRFKPAEENKPETDYAKAKKEAERKDRSWKALEAEKAQARASIEAERQQVAREKAEWEQHKQTVKVLDEHGFSAKQYADAAVNYERLAEKQLRDGDPENAAGNFALAAKARIAAQNVGQKEYEGQVAEHRDGFVKTWNGVRDQVLTQHPEIKDADNPVAKEMWKLLDEKSPDYRREFRYLPHGFQAAHEVARLRLDAAEAVTLRAELKKAQEKLDHFNKITSISGEAPIEARTPKDFNSMSLAEQTRELEKMASRADEFAYT